MTKFFMIKNVKSRQKYWAGSATIMALSLATIFSASAQTPPAAQTQAAAAKAKADADAKKAAQEIDEIVVTGTSIRGAAPVGQGVIQIDRSVIEATAAVSVQQLLATAAPAVNGFGSAGQAAGNFEPRLRSLGGSSSASTLVLIDGHRIAPANNNGNTADPNIIPAGAVERVEILADGASALYGSDAVAGVINIITRRHYDGWEVSGQLGFGKNYSTKSTNLIYGRSWDDGSMLATYGYTYRSPLAAADRNFVSGNQSNTGPGATGAGGANFNNYACSPATFIPATGLPGAGQVFAFPYATGSGILNSPTTTGLCSTVKYADLLPREETSRLYISMRQSLGDKIKVSASLLNSNRKTTTRNSRGQVTNITVFGPGSTPPSNAGQINPFFTAPPGVNRGTVSFNFNDLLGPGAFSESVTDTFMGNLGLDYDLGHNWLAALTFTYATPKFNTRTVGTVCQACAILALNGTDVASGVATTNLQGNGFGTVTNVTRFPLTTANALNVWSATGAGTSQAVITQLTDSNTFSYETRPIKDLLLKFDGPLYTMPGGDVKTAFGAEYYRQGRQTAVTNTSPVGGTTTNATFGAVNYDDRVVTSFFGEVIFPLVGESMNIPLVRRLDFDIAGRYDRYSDLIQGANTTKNPKYGVNWGVTQGLLLRASYGTSFTAPQHGATQFGAGSTITDYFGNGGAAFQLPQGYLNSAFLGCPATGTCTISSASGKNGIVTFGGNPDLKPQTGKTWSMGFDFQGLDLLPGFRASATYWSAVYNGIITNLTNISQAAATPGLGDILIINPTAAQLAKYTFGRTQTTPISTPIDFINNITQANYFNARGKGLDFDVGYEFPTAIGKINVGVAGEVKLSFMKQTGSGDWLEALNIANTTNTLSPVRFTGRGSAGWRNNGWRASLFANYTSGYYLTDTTAPYVNSACPANVTTTGLGCQKVGSNLTFDTHISYDLPSTGWFSDLQIYADINNIADKRSPWVNSTDTITGNGSLNTWGSPLGRVMSVGFRKNW